jgi:hypothetical protein
MRARCDTFDAAPIQAAIASGETTPRRAYETYCAMAARPYARSTWELLLKRPAAAPPATDQQIAEPWSELTPVKPSNVLTIMSDRASLKVRGGALYVSDPHLNEPRLLVYERRSVKPLAIVMTGWGGFVTIGAMRFCSDYKVAIIILDWTRDFLTVVAPPSRQSATLIRAQAAADPLPQFAVFVVCATLLGRETCKSRLAGQDCSGDNR